MQTMQTKLLKQVSICAFIIALIPAAAQAQDMAQGEAIDILPARSLSDDMVTVGNNDATHPMLRLTPDRSELVRLEQDASTVIIGNPAHLSVMVDTSRTLVLVPKLPGATHFSVLDAKGGVIMQRHVIVASPKEHYVRVRRACASSNDPACQQTSVFYCPDMCHNVEVVTPKTNTEAVQAFAKGMTEAALDSKGEEKAKEENGEAEGDEEATAE